MSGVKISFATNSSGDKICAKNYEEAGSPYPMYCGGNGCKAMLTYVHGFKRESYGKTQFVPSYFRLKDGEDHSESCEYRSDGNHNILLKDSDSDVGLALARGETLFRIHVLDFKDEISLSKKAEHFSQSQPSDRRKRKYSGKGRAQTYIRTLSGLLEVYNYGIKNPQSKMDIKLLVGGEEVSWIDFFYSCNRFSVLREKLSKSRIVSAAVVATVHVIRFPDSSKGGFSFIELYPQQVSGNEFGIYPVIKLSRGVSPGLFSCNQKILFYGRFSIPKQSDCIIDSAIGCEIRTIVSNERQVLPV